MRKKTVPLRQFARKIRVNSPQDLIMRQNITVSLNADIYAHDRQAGAKQVQAATLLPHAEYHRQA